MFFKKMNSKLAIIAATIVVSNSALADVPAGYYDSVNLSNAQALRASLHEIIDDHQRFPYTSSATDTWDILEAADQDPDNAGNVIDIYLNASYAKQGGGNTNYNREHSWPKSYGFPKDGSTNYAYTDTHHLFIANSGYNSSRSNKPYANCTSGCSEKVTQNNNNRGGTSAESNWTAGSGNTGSWQTWSGRKGDVARALMYMAVRYEGGTHGVTGHSEPDLILTDDRNLIGQSNQGVNIDVAYMGLKSVLIQWHKDDPVDDFERRHNDTVYSFQGNRNPFIDNPDYVACVFEDVCSGGSGSDTTPPATPTGLTASGGNGEVSLAWTGNFESDLAGYNVYRSDTAGGTYVKVNGATVNTSAYTDTNVAASSTYYYKVSAVDTSANESVKSSSVSATTDGGSTGGGTAWINEFHYDNSSTDVNEFVEVAGSAGTDLTGWQVIAYNGSNGESYKTINLSGTLANQTNGFGFADFAASGLQNGGPDGLALVDASGTVVQFLSYEGTMTATNGPAAGMTSTSVGVSETSSTPVGYSLQLTGTGTDYSQFTWSSPMNDTPGSLNTNQSFGGAAPVNEAPVASFTATCTDLDCAVNASSSYDVDGSVASYSWNFGDGASASGQTSNRTYGNDGSYTITLTVTDNDGASTVTTKQVTVEKPVVLPWINEFHYDNNGTDRSEFVEVAGLSGTNLSGWRIEAVNGSNGQVYKTVNLSGTIDNEQNGYGALGYTFSGLQNGPDGLVLINDLGEVVQFISYEGTISAVNGAAAGMTSTNIGVSESSTGSRRDSLQLKGSGSTYDDFYWAAPSRASKGSLNTNQNF
jgi:endonuclease I/PKD repeat protein